LPPVFSREFFLFSFSPFFLHGPQASSLLSSFRFPRRNHAFFGFLFDLFCLPSFMMRHRSVPVIRELFCDFLVRRSSWAFFGAFSSTMPCREHGFPQCRPMTRKLFLSFRKPFPREEVSPDSHLFLLDLHGWTHDDLFQSESVPSSFKALFRFRRAAAFFSLGFPFIPFPDIRYWLAAEFWRTWKLPSSSPLFFFPFPRGAAKLSNSFLSLESAALGRFFLRPLRSFVRGRQFFLHEIFQARPAMLLGAQTGFLCLTALIAVRLSTADTLG